MNVGFHVRNLRLLSQSGAPPAVFFHYFEDLLQTVAAKAGRNGFRSAAELMAPIDHNGNFTTHWFNRNATRWMKIFESERLVDRPIDVLEIGSWEGRSTCFALHYLRGARLTAVDTWQGGTDNTGDPKLMHIEELFDANVARFSGRVHKVKCYSGQFFVNKDPGQMFDLIYVDGSHFADDVMADALHAFASLKPGGILIFDDYTWAFYVKARDNPAFAINCFLRMKKGEYKILSAGEQLCIKKLAAA